MSGSPERSTPIQTSEEFFQRLNPEDAEIVRSIVENISQLAEQYDNEPLYGSLGFFGVYAIGGLVTKQGERPDIDVLIVTNARWDRSCRPKHRGVFTGDPVTLSGDWVAGSLLDAFEKKDYLVELLDKIPNEYDDVGVNPKAMLRLTPKSELDGRKSIDIVYAKTTFARDIRNLADFETIDVDGDGNPLPRIPLLKREGLGQAIQWRD